MAAHSPTKWQWPRLREVEVTQDRDLSQLATWLVGVLLLRGIPDFIRGQLA